jgi:hypothetical protein
MLGCNATLGKVTAALIESGSALFVSLEASVLYVLAKHDVMLCKLVGAA